VPELWTLGGNESHNNKNEQNMKTRTITPLLAVMILITFKSPAIPIPGNLVNNGDFTSPNGVSIPGWSYSGFMWSAYNGVNGGSFVGINTYFSQTLTTQPGQTYLLEFYTTAAVPGIGQGGPYGLSVTCGSQNAIGYTLTQDSYNWIREDLLVTASGSQTTLAFNRIYGSIPYLDDVSVTSVPDVSFTLFLMMISMAGIYVFLVVVKQNNLPPNKSPEPTAVGAGRSAIAVHVARRRWLSFLR
jgi:hypothetical protein